MTPEALKQIYQDEVEESYRASRLGSSSAVPLLRALRYLTPHRATIPDAMKASGLSFSQFSEALPLLVDLGLVELYYENDGEFIRLTPSAGTVIAAKLSA